MPGLLGLVLTMPIVFNVSGGDEFRRKLGQVEADLRRRMRAALADTVLFGEVAIADKINEYDAVDTGRLKGSMGAQTAFTPGDTATEIAADGSRAVVGTNLSYAIPVHEGYTRKDGRTVKGRPYMADAVPEIQAHYRQAVEDALRGL